MHFPSSGGVHRIPESEISELIKPNLLKYSKSTPREVRGKEKQEESYQGFQPDLAAHTIRRGPCILS